MNQTQGLLSEPSPQQPHIQAVLLAQRADLGYKADLLQQLTRMSVELKEGYTGLREDRDSEWQDVLHFTVAQHIHRLANGELVKGRTLRQILNFPDGTVMDDMLDIPSLSDYSRTDILTFNRDTETLGLSALHDLILMLGKSDAAEISAQERRAAVVVSALVGISSARMDSNWRLMGEVYSWCHRRFPEGATTTQYVWLEAADVYNRLGNTNEITSASLKDHIHRIDKLLEHFRDVVDSKLRADQFLNLALFLLEGVAQLPHQALSSEEVKRWIRELVTELDTGQHGYADDLTNSRLCRFRYLLSQIYLAWEDTSAALNAAIYALQYAPEWDLRFMELCRLQILTLEQEVASSQGLRTEITKHLENALKEAIQDINETVASQEDELQRKHEDLRRRIENSTRQSRDEIRSSLMRVIEILGVFIGIAGVAVTSVGGIVASRSLGESMLIFGIGYLTIVSLFGILYWILERSRSKGLEFIADEGDNT